MNSGHDASTGTGGAKRQRSATKAASLNPCSCESSPAKQTSLVRESETSRDAPTVVLVERRAERLVVHRHRRRAVDAPRADCVGVLAQVVIVLCSKGGRVRYRRCPQTVPPRARDSHRETCTAPHSSNRRASAYRPRCPRRPSASLYSPLLAGCCDTVPPFRTVFRHTNTRQIFFIGSKLKCIADAPRR